MIGKTNPMMVPADVWLTQNFTDLLLRLNAHSPSGRFDRIRLP